MVQPRVVAEEQENEKNEGEEEQVEERQNVWKSRHGRRILSVCISLLKEFD